MSAWEGVVWAVGLTVLFIIYVWQVRRRPAKAETEAVAPKGPPALKPRTPRDCPVCQRPHPQSLWGHARRPGVQPWPERKKRSGKPKEYCTGGWACPNPVCEYWGDTDPTFHALVSHGYRNGIQQLKCQACKTRFTSRWGTDSPLSVACNGGGGGAGAVSG